MNINKTLGLALGILMGAAVLEANGQSAYFNAVTNLNPVGYWPMHEVEAAAQGDIETNYGTLGPLGEGFYPDWVAPVPGFKRGVPGAIIGDSDTAVNFTRGGNPAGGTYTNCLFVPHNSPLTTLVPPFTVECWFFPTNTASDDIWAQSGDEGFNVGNAGGNVGSLAGIRFVWESGTTTGFQIFNLDGAQNSAGFTGNTNSGSAQNSPTNNWYHLVVTCDANTNFSVYTNGSLAPLNSLYSGIANGPGSYTPDYWTPLTIGSGRGGTRACAGYIDEFAVYTNVIGDISTHYNDGISGTPGQYFHDVTNDKPVVYLRMDAPATYTPPGIGAWPALTSYGVTNGVPVGNGVYSPGTGPGVITTSPLNPNGVPFAGVPNHITALSGISSFADAGNAAAFNPTGSNANFTVTALFRGNPCDNRIQSIVGHGTNSWQMSITTNGCIVFNAGNGNKAAGGTSQAAGDIRTVGVYNDGKWHQVVVINTTNVVSIYVDGLLDTNGTATGIVTTNRISGNASDVLIGSDPTYTNNPTGAGRQFAGQVCDVAFWTNALTAGQVQLLYSNCQVAPYIIAQPQPSYSGNQGANFTNMAVIANGSANLGYQWYTNGVGLAGQTASNLVLNPLTAGNAGADYYVIITNLYGAVTSTVTSLTVFGPPTFPNYSPVTYTNAAGATITTNFMNLYVRANPVFKVTVQGAQPIGLFWFTNGVNLAGQNGTNFALTNVQVTGLLNISCVASNVVGLGTNLWTATVLSDPTNNANGLAPYPQQVLANNPIGYWRLNEGNDNGNGDNGYVAYDYAGGNDALYTNSILGQTSYSFTTDPSDSSAIFGEFGSLPANNEYAGQIRNIDFAATNGANGEFTVEAWANGINNGLFPQIAGSALVTKGIYGVDDEFNLGIDATKLHYQFYVRSASGTVYTVASGTSPALDNQWHHVVGVCDETNGLLSLYYDGQLVNTTAIPTNSGVFEAPETMTIGASTADGVTYSNQFIGNVNDVAVYNNALTPAGVAAQYVSLGSAPVVSPAPPATVGANGGGTLTIPALALGTPNSGYYWTDENANTNVAAGTTNGPLLNATLTFSNVPGSWNGDTFKLTVTNAYGMNTYSVLIAVNTNAPLFTLNLPSPVTVVQGNSYVYSIGADGITPITYQWYSGASMGSQTAILNATNSTLTVTAGSPGNVYYSVAVSNQFGGVLSGTSQFISISSTRPTLTSGYDTNLLLLNPAGYWPMHETQSAAAGDTEVNYGSLGVLGTGYYPDWVNNYGGFVRQVPGALVGDSDTAESFTRGTGNSGTSISFTNGLYVPHNSPLATLVPPFTVECWFYPTNAPSGEAIWAQTGAVGLNDGGLGNLVTFNGIMLNWANGTFVPYGFNKENATLTGNNNDKVLGPAAGNSGGSPVEPLNHWYQVVVTCDASTNFTLYVNGSLSVGPHSAVGIYAPDSWTPLTIGSGNGGLRSSSGLIDEFAVYTNAINSTNIATHYNDALAGIPATYFADVMSENPVIYLRMDAANYSAPSASFLPVLFNYGSAGANGLYTPGTVPGVLPGPSTNAGGASLTGLSGNVSMLSGVSSFADAGYSSAFNPAGSNANFSVTAWFRGNPCDGRIQSIVGHGTNSWELTMTTNGCIVFNAGNGNQAAGGTGQAAGDVTTMKVYNDGNWHQVAAVNQANHISIYVDGLLDTNGTPAGIAPTSTIPGNTQDVMIGSDPNYTNTPTGVGASFAGQICDVAFLTNALNVGEVSALYAAAINPSQVPAYVAPEPPVNVSVAPGGALSLTAGVAGTANVGYQWQFMTNGGGTEVLQTGAGNSPLNANLSVPSVPLAWSGGQLALTVTNAYGTNSAFVAISVVVPVNSTPTNIVAAVTNGVLYLTWPADHTGWQLQAQTNPVSKGLGANWANDNPSTGTNQVAIPINLTNGTVFYRLTY